MRTTTALAALLLLLCGCGTVMRAPIHDAAHQARPPFVDIAVNSGPRHEADLNKLYDILATRGVRCGMRAMSLGAEQIVVERKDFQTAKALAEQIVTNEKLTVRIFQSPNFADSPATSLLDVWERGKKTREEKYKIYP